MASVRRSFSGCRRTGRWKCFCVHKKISSCKMQKNRANEKRYKNAWFLDRASPDSELVILDADLQIANGQLPDEPMRPQPTFLEHSPARTSRNPEYSRQRLQPVEAGCYCKNQEGFRTIGKLGKRCSRPGRLGQYRHSARNEYHADAGHPAALAPQRRIGSANFRRTCNRTFGLQRRHRPGLFGISSGSRTFGRRADHRSRLRTLDRGLREQGQSPVEGAWMGSRCPSRRHFHADAWAESPVPPGGRTSLRV